MLIHDHHEAYLGCAHYLANEVKLATAPHSVGFYIKPPSAFVAHDLRKRRISAQSSTDITLRPP